MDCWWVDGILLLLYSYIIRIPVAHGRFAAPATAQQQQLTAAASVSLPGSPLAVFAAVWLLLVLYQVPVLLDAIITRTIRYNSCR